MTMKMDEISELFEQAIQYQSEEERKAFIDNACDNLADRKKLSDLVQAHGETCSILDKPNVAVDFANLVSQNTAPAEGDIIGNYRLLQLVGEGGMGQVFMADQTEPVKRRVAIKIIKSEVSSKHILARFEAEREALARLDHPNITRILDAGVTESGLPYFVMELVRGDSLIEYCDRNKLSIKDRIGLLEQICLAVHHAHQKGILHRDIKPANIMVTMHDGVPVPKVIDFGIAKALDRPLTQQTLFTRYGDMVGTPQYMSPEQAEQSGLDIDLRTDVYSLGIVMYELLTGTTPIEANSLEGKGILGVLETVRDCDTETPSMRITRTLPLNQQTSVHRSTSDNLLRRLVRGELDWITMKALAKDRTQRYDSAAELARDLRSYLNGESVTAAAPTFVYQARKLYQRHRTICISLATAAIVLVALSLISLNSAISNNHLRSIANKNAEESRKKSEELQQLNSQLERARDQARAAEAKALGLANEKKKQAALERAKFNMVQSLIQSVSTPAQAEWLRNLSTQLIKNLSTPQLEIQMPFKPGFEIEFQPDSSQGSISKNSAGQSVSTQIVARDIQVFHIPTTPDGTAGQIGSPLTPENLTPENMFKDNAILQSEYLDFLLTEYRKEFGNQHPIVAECLLDSCVALSDLPESDWLTIESRTRETMAILKSPSEPSDQIPFLETKAAILLARSLEGQNRTAESEPWLQFAQNKISDPEPSFSPVQIETLQKLQSKAELSQESKPKP